MYKNKAVEEFVSAVLFFNQYLKFIKINLISKKEKK